MQRVLLYILDIVVLHYAFMFVPTYTLPGNIVWPPVARLVGFVFVLRNYAQREIGNKVIVAMFVGGFIS